VLHLRRPPEEAFALASGKNCLPLGRRSFNRVLLRDFNRSPRRGNLKGLDDVHSGPRSEVNGEIVARENRRTMELRKVAFLEKYESLANIFRIAVD